MVNKGSSKPQDDVQPDDEQLPPVEVNRRSDPAPSVSSPPPSKPSSLEKQVKFFKGVTVFLFLVLLGAIGTFLFLRHMNRPVQILVDGKVLATAKNYQAGVALLADAEKTAVGDAYPADSFVRLQKVEFVRTSGDAPIDSDDTIRHTLASNLKLKVRAYVIKIDGRPTIGLPTSQAATQALAIVKEHYASMPPNAQIVGQPTFRERVVIDRVSIPAASAKHDSQDAAAYFWSLAPARTYVVKPGDRGYKIAVSHHISFANFLLANAGKDMNKLQPGDVVNLSRSHPILSVEVKKQMTATEPIVPDEDPDRAGKRRVVYAVTYTNGEVTKREVLSMVTLSRPSPRMTL